MEKMKFTILLMGSALIFGFVNQECFAGHHKTRPQILSPRSKTPPKSKILDNRYQNFLESVHHNRISIARLPDYVDLAIQLWKSPRSQGKAVIVLAHLRNQIHFDMVAQALINRAITLKLDLVFQKEIHKALVSGGRT